ncbi:ProQ/FINO family protein [Legionella dresdenensis]|uniref:ProQ/FINO family protein n=1 Tax=Legionella dresdenensis TaxID=450200 RepID=A0ABV8CH65_9GAMM
MSQQNVSAKKDKQIIIDWLIEHFPNAFFKKGSQVKPLQIGIFDEIAEFYDRLEEPPFSKKSLREGLSYYSSSPAYLNCQKANTARIDLYGNEVDVVTEEQAKYAYQRYQQRYAEKKK